MASEDPALAFFPDGAVDLYGALKVSKDASFDDVKRAYKRQALIYHPDKLAQSASAEERERANTKFQQIGFAFAVLKDETRRRKYDETGSTEEIASGKTEAEWKDYFKELWSGEVNGQTIEQFKKTYQGSEEERKDVIEAYETVKGDLDELSNHVMCSTIDDESRFVEMIKSAIDSGEIKETKKWKASMKDLEKGKAKRTSKAAKEAKEAEQLAKELGVHDKLYANPKAKGSKKGSAHPDDNDDEAALRALIRGNQTKRMDLMMESLEARYGANSAKENRKKRKSDERAADSTSSSKGKKVKAAEPSEEEFAAAQARVDARRAGKK